MKVVTSFLFIVGLLLVVRAIFPLLSPSRWRHWVILMTQASDGYIRGVSGVCLVVGLLLLAITRF